MTVLLSLDRHVSLDLASCSLPELSAIARDGRSGLTVIEALLTRVAAEAQRRENAGDGVVASDLVRGEGELSRARADAINARATLSAALPAAGDAVASGAARPENADALVAAVRRLNPGEQARLAAHDTDLARRAATDTPETFARHLAQRARDARDRPDPMTDRSRAEREKARSYLHLSRKLNGRWCLNGDLADEWGTVIDDRLRAHARTLAGDDPVNPNHLAQALHDLVTGRTDTSGGGFLGHHHMGIGYIVDAHTLFTDTPSSGDRPPDPANSGGPGEAAPPAGLCPTDPVRPDGPDGSGGPSGSEACDDPGSGDGSTARSRPSGSAGGTEGRSGTARRRVVAENWGGYPVEPETIRRLACDADLYAILIGAGGEPRGVHQTHRSANRHQRLQLRALYPTCPLDGTTPFERCEIHHVNLAHTHGGATVLANLLPLSSRWHHRIHDLGWQLTMRADRTLELRSPDGKLQRIIPPPTPITRQRE